jgi:hypothetical protein
MQGLLTLNAKLKNKYGFDDRIAALNEVITI